jgi:hypothetical protein
MRYGVVPRILFVALITLTALAASARPARAWSYQLNGVRCYFNSTFGRSVLATAPLQSPNGNVTSWYGGGETVYWRSQLQQYWSGRWHVVNNSFPWLKGAANAAGILPFNLGGVYYWVNSKTHNILEHHEYRGLGHGSYRVKEYFYWPASKQTRASYARHYNQQYASFCRL